jgi:hypothetical protein
MVGVPIAGKMYNGTPLQTLNNLASIRLVKPRDRHKAIRCIFHANFLFLNSWQIR